MYKAIKDEFTDRTSHSIKEVYWSQTLIYRFDKGSSKIEK